MIKKKMMIIMFKKKLLKPFICLWLITVIVFIPISTAAEIEEINNYNYSSKGVETNMVDYNPRVVNNSSLYNCNIVSASGVEFYNRPEAETRSNICMILSPIFGAVASVFGFMAKYGRNHLLLGFSNTEAALRTYATLGYVFAALSLICLGIQMAINIHESTMEGEPYDPDS